MPTSRQAYANLPPASQNAFRGICIEWAKQFSRFTLSTSEDEDQFIDFVLEAIELGDLILQETPTGFSLVTTEKGQRGIERFNAAMN